MSRRTDRRSPARAPPDPLPVLARAPLFGALPEELRRRFAAGPTATLRGGEALWRAGEPARRLALVLTGRFKLARSAGGREVILDVAVPGDVLGEVAFSASAAYQSDVVCLRRATVLFVPAAALRERLESDPAATLVLAMDLASQVVRLYRALESLSAGAVERRLASVLVRLADRAGEPFPGGVLIPLRLRRSDLAALAATTLESASRRISEWRRRGVLLPQPAGYLVRDLAALRELAGEPAGPS